MGIGDVSVVVGQWCMAMAVRMRLDDHLRAVFVLVVLVVDMGVLVLERVVCVKMPVALAQKERDAARHGDDRTDLPAAPSLAKERDSHEGTRERRCCEDG